jgi:hypothetical protein
MHLLRIVDISIILSILETFAILGFFAGGLFFVTLTVRAMLGLNPI